MTSFSFKGEISFNARGKEHEDLSKNIFSLKRAKTENPYLVQLIEQWHLVVTL